jgi:GNAT superfamily N-acetyltransferase
LEHDSVETLVQAARRCLLKTYEDLALSVPGTSVSHENGMMLLLGPAKVSFCCCAGGFDIEEGGTEALVLELRRLAIDHPGLTVYAASGDRPSSITHYLEKAGFRSRMALQQLGWFPSKIEPEIDMQAAVGQVQRTAAAMFMSSQFFSGSSKDYRKVVSLATANSSHQIWSCGHAHAPAGAVMTAHTEECIGIYNLCVRDNIRGEGLGTRMLRTLMNMAYTERLPAVLQCEESLVSWYTRQGFQRLGEVRSFRYDPRMTF